jgi:hypothetical protein
VSDILVRIKRAVLNGQYAFSEKARLEMEADCLTELDIAEAILNATSIYKTIRSTRPTRRGARERLYVIESTNMTGLPIYTKGKLVKQAGVETYYFLVSSKRSR